MAENKVIKIKYQNLIAQQHPLCKIEKGDWIDLCTAELVHMYAGEYKEISLGVAICLPKGYEAIVAPRSSTFKKHGILCVNSIGIIDNSYCGEDDYWKFPAICMVGETIIPAGTRIAQFRILRNMPITELVTVHTLGKLNRGGIGSTGD